MRGIASGLVAAVTSVVGFVIASRRPENPIGWLALAAGAPLLADLGLVAAPNGQAKKSALPVTIQADGLGRFPEDTEAAMYFCCLEALQNTAKYAGATRQPSPCGRSARR